MSSLVDVSELDELAHTVMKAVPGTPRAETVHARPLHPGTVTNWLFVKPFEAVLLSESNEVYLILEGEQPTVALRIGIFGRQLTQRPFGWYISRLTSDPSVGAAYDGHKSYEAHRQGILDQVYRQLSDLLPPEGQLRQSVKLESWPHRWPR